MFSKVSARVDNISCDFKRETTVILLSSWLENIYCMFLCLYLIHNHVTNLQKSHIYNSPVWLPLGSNKIETINVLFTNPPSDVNSWFSKGAGSSAVRYNDDRAVLKRTSVAQDKQQSGAGEKEAQSSKFLNITDPAFGGGGGRKGNAQQDEKWLPFSLKILSPSHIQQIRLRERFKKILTHTENFWAVGGGESGKMVGSNL